MVTPRSGRGCRVPVRAWPSRAPPTTCAPVSGRCPLASPSLTLQPSGQSGQAAPGDLASRKMYLAWRVQSAANQAASHREFGIPSWAKGRTYAEPMQMSESGLPIEPVYDNLAGFDPRTALGEPGEYPFTRGVYPAMYTKQMQ